MIYMKTELGQAALRSRSVSLTPRQRAAFIVFDGKRSAEDVFKATAGLGVTAEDVAHLAAINLIEAVALAASVAAPAPQAKAAAVLSAVPVPVVDASPTLDAQSHFLKAWPIATKLTASLGLRGFRLNLAVESAGDLAKLKELAPRIKEAVGSDKFRELEAALYH